MAPNNGLSVRGRSKSRAPSKKKSTTSVLDKGTVEDRGMGTKVNSRRLISKQIQNFLNGEGSFTPKAETRAFFTVWTFVTRLPGPTWVDHHPGFLMRGMAYFPLAGSLIGIFVSVFFDLMKNTLGLPLYIASITSEAASLWLTGCFHEDGLADSADGIGGGWSRDQILTIMTDTRLGTYGCAVLLLYIIAKLQLLTSLGESNWILYACEGAGPALIVTHTLARLTSPLLIKTNDYVDEQGPKYKFYSFMVEAKHLVSWERASFAILTSSVVSYYAYGAKAAMILITSVLFAVYISGRYADYLLGGVMGDYLGATICMTEVSLLTIILALPNLSKYLVTLENFRNFFLSVVTNRIDLLTAIYNEELSVLSLIKFLVVVIGTYIWCCNVGHSPVFVRSKVTKVTKNSNDGEDNEDRDQDVNIALDYNDGDC